MKSMQETFDHIVKNLLKQNACSMFDDEDCAYRGRDNLKCAVGHCIDDKYYDYDFELVSATSHKILNAVSNSGWYVGDDAKIFYAAMQRIHDNVNVDEWPLHFKGFAKDFELDWNF